MAAPTTPQLPASALAAGIAQLATIVETSLDGTAARLHFSRSRGPVLELDPAAPEGDRQAALIDAWNALVFGAAAATGARIVPRLRLVS